MNFELNPLSTVASSNIASFTPERSDPQTLKNRLDQTAGLVDAFVLANRDDPLPEWPGLPNASTRDATRRFHDEAADFRQQMQMMSFQAMMGVSPDDLGKMDIESLMFMVQMGRANLMEGQLRAQMVGIQQNTDTSNALRELIDKLKQLQAPDVPGPQGKVITEDVAKLLNQLGIKKPDGSAYKTGDVVDDKEVDNLASTAQSKLDINGSNQQLEMLKMQSLMSKRNEAFDTLSNFIKKVNDIINNVIGNMR